MKFIKNFNIQIGQAVIGGLPCGDAFISFVINERFVQCRLKDFKDWINDIYESKGKRSEKGYKAKKNLDDLFEELIAPFMVNTVFVESPLPEAEQ